MTALAEPHIPHLASPREALTWVGAAVVVAAMHFAAAYAFVVFTPDAEPPPAAEQALEIDLTPFVMSMPEAVESEALQTETAVDRVEPVQEETPAETAELTPPDTVEPVEESVPPEQSEVVKESAVQPETAVPVEPEKTEIVQETSEPQKPEPVESVTEVQDPEPMETAIVPEAEVNLPKPKAAKASEKPEQPAAKPAPKKARQKPAEAGAQPKAKAPPKSKASSKAVAAKAPTVSPARWHSQVYAAIARRKPRSKGVSGTVSVRFVVSSSGALISVGIARSSGNGSLDQAALRMVRSARIPAAPAGTSGSRHPFTVPVRFE